LRDAASYLSLSPASLRRLVQAGELRVIIMSDSGHAPFLLDVRDLDQWVERRKRTL
jgi:Helix-turn-helix domain